MALRRARVGPRPADADARPGDDPRLLRPLCRAHEPREAVHGPERLAVGLAQRKRQCGAIRVTDAGRLRLRTALRRRLDAALAIAELSVDGRLPIELPGKIICIGLNYAEHIAEGGRQAPDRPVMFAKFANAVIADGEPIIRPEGTHALDLEVELGVVIGRRARRVSKAQAMDHVAGYVVVNDVSARDWQGVPAALRDGEKGDGQWLRAKGSDTFLPMGPVFVTKDAI